MRKFCVRGVFVEVLSFMGMWNLTQSSQRSQRHHTRLYADGFALMCRCSLRLESGVKPPHSKLVGEPAVEDGLVGVDAAVAEEGPVAALVFALGGIAFDHQDFFFVVAGFGNYLAVWRGDE